ncbi:MAG: alpha/beta hydrolase [Planctomycetes bacterium]|nr:alpha/beta hydrolase [Planctomycetota bacterium]
MRHVRLLVLLLILPLALPAQDKPPARKARGPIPEGVAVERDVEYGKGGEVSLKLDAYRPEKAREKPVPALIHIHGGGWRGGDKAGGGALLAWFVGKGYVVFSINYRLSGVAPFPAAVEDCKCAVRWVRANAEKYGVDPEKIGVFGGSAGGHLSLMVGLVDERAGLEGKGGNEGVSSRVQAVVDWFGPADLTIGGDKFEGGRGSAVTRFLGGEMKGREELYRQASPVTHIGGDDPPVLVIHGDKDETVPYSQSEALFEKLGQGKVEALLIQVENAGHGFRPVGGTMKPTADEINQSTLDWFEKHLK